VDDGELYDNILGGRVFYLSAKTFGEMVKLLGDSISPPAAHALLWNLGHRYGVALGKKAVQATANTEEAVKMLSYAAFRSGWGRNNVTNRLQQDNVVEVVFENCVFCHAGKPSKPHMLLLSGHTWRHSGGRIREEV